RVWRQSRRLYDGSMITESCALSAVLVLQRRRVPVLFPKRQYSFLNLPRQFVWQVNDVAVSPSALVHLIRSLRHLNERLVAFRLNDLYVRNADTADIHCCKTSKRTPLKFANFFDSDVHRFGLLRFNRSTASVA